MFPHHISSSCPHMSLSPKQLGSGSQHHRRELNNWALLTIQRAPSTNRSPSLREGARLTVGNLQLADAVDVNK